MNEHEEQFIASFIIKSKQDRYRFLLGSDDPKRRGQGVNLINHCRDLNEKYATWLPSNADIVDLLKRAGSPNEAYLISCSQGLDRATLPLQTAVEAVALMPDNGWGTVVSCIPGQLAYYYDEEGSRRAILQRLPRT